MNGKKPKRQSRLLAASIAAAAGFALLASRSQAAHGADASRYPYDPVCAWGRIADGRGMLVRCLSQSESAQLRNRTASPRAAPRQTPAAGASTTRSAGGAQQLTVKVGPVLVESGSLPAAQDKLAKARDRFAECVAEHGGLSRPEGEVRVRFLVRERGRAEGVGVVRRRSVSKAAAQCIADVVDRRAVGLPDAPIVAATLVVGFQRRAK